MNGKQVEIGWLVLVKDDNWVLTLREDSLGVFFCGKTLEYTLKSHKVIATNNRKRYNTDNYNNEEGFL